MLMGRIKEKSEDKYCSFNQLEESEDRDNYEITDDDRKTKIVIVAPHGGKIEKGTSEIARAIAGDEYSLYLFEGKRTTKNYKNLHITSTNFDEPKCLKLIDSSEIVVTIHGAGHDTKEIHIGGKDENLAKKITLALTEREFDVKFPSKKYPGEGIRNICNLGKSGKGVQIELENGLREELFESLKQDGLKKPTALFDRFVESIREAIEM